MSYLNIYQSNFPTLGLFPKIMSLLWPSIDLANFIFSRPIRFSPSFGSSTFRKSPIFFLSRRDIVHVSHLHSVTTLHVCLLKFIVALKISLLEIRWFFWYRKPVFFWGKWLVFLTTSLLRHSVCYSCTYSLHPMLYWLPPVCNITFIFFTLYTFLSIRYISWTVLQELRFCVYKKKKTYIIK